MVNVQEKRVSETLAHARPRTDAGRGRTVLRRIRAERVRRGAEKIVRGLKRTRENIEYSLAVREALHFMNEHKIDSVEELKRILSDSNVRERLKRAGYNVERLERGAQILDEILGNDKRRRVTALRKLLSIEKKLSKYDKHALATIMTATQILVALVSAVNVPGIRETIVPFEAVIINIARRA